MKIAELKSMSRIMALAMMIIATFTAVSYTHLTLPTIA